MATKTKRVVITGGGTGGHVFPAIAIAEELRDRNYEVLYVGSDRGLESRLVPERKFSYFTVKSIQVKNKSPLKVVGGLFTLLRSILWSMRFLIKNRPLAVVGVGGYVSVPISVAAYILRTPLYLQEQNVSVGIANRFLGKLAKKIFVGFEEACASFPNTECVVSGNPIRKEFSNTDFEDLTKEPTILFVFGGSQGAVAINDVILKYLPEIEKRFPKIHVIHQTGKKDLERVAAAYEKTSLSHEVRAFISDMVGCYNRASLVISRSGALTISELMAAKRPAILIPYPRKGQNDQTANARMLQDKHVARVVEQGPEFDERFWRVFEETFTPQTIENMRENYSALNVPNALATIGDHLDNDILSQS